MGDTQNRVGGGARTIVQEFHALLKEKALCYSIRWQWIGRVCGGIIIIENENES